MKLFLKTALALLGAGLWANANAAILQIEFENLGGADDFVFTPLWVGLHDGSFDLFDPGSPASAGLAQIAETGDASTLSAEFAAPMRLQLAGIGNPAGFGGAPVVEGGETAVGQIQTINPAAYQYLTFASMVIPSNDAFFGNGDPMGIRIFNDDGSFANPASLDILGRDIWDAGSEVNNAMGAAFSALGGMDSREFGTVQRHPGLDDFVGTATAAGQTIGRAPGLNEPIARISFSLLPDPQPVPAPGALSLLALGMVGTLALRRRRADPSA